MRDRQPTVKEAMQYARDVVAGKVTACRFIRLACKRQLDDLKNGHKRGLHWLEDEAQRAIDWFNFNHHIKGPLAGQRIILEDWQAFQVACVFGWRRWTTEARTLYRSDKRDPYTWPRRFRKVYDEEARKQGKTTKLAPIGLYLMVADGEAGAEVYAAATTREQAKILFSIAKSMVKKSPELNRLINTYQNNISHLDTESKFEPLSADFNSLDGLNIHGALVDEVHAHKNRELLEVLETATGARKNPLMWMITTAGVDQAGICYEERAYSIQILEGIIEDDSVFSTIFTMDVEDVGKNHEKTDYLFKNEKLWLKANPNLGVAASAEDIKRKIKAAQNSPAKMAALLRYHFNIWVSAQNAWLNMEKWLNQPKRPKLKKLKKEACILSLDLASKTDLACLLQFIPAGEVYAIYPRFYLPEEALNNDDTPLRVRNLYKQWSDAGYITLTDGEILDEEIIEDDIREIAAAYEVQEIVFDPWHATRLAGNMLSEGLPMVELPNTVRHMSEAMKQCEAWVLKSKLAHGNNPVLNWNAANVIAKEDKKENIFPNKEANYLKIDGMVALFMAIARHIRIIEAGPSVYESRGALVL